MITINGKDYNLPLLEKGIKFNTKWCHGLTQFDPAEMLPPELVAELKELVNKGQKNIDVVCNGINYNMSLEDWKW